ncbi:hypothetical protein ACFS27_01705 [Promicromonospora vindobonensis]|uniref:Uncharacterized protein n=1 Tax=Promicromonospora vindobonensis TaxID=195748 RepID=A0ABW5VLW9_9MICO
MTTQSDDLTGVEVSGWTWRIEPPTGWLVVPATGLDDPDEIAEWEQEATAIVRESVEPRPDEAGETVELDDAGRAELDQLAVDSVANLRAFADGMAPGGNRVVGAIGVLGNGPVPVLVAVGVSDPAEPDDGLMAALGATGGSPSAPPNIEHLDLPDGDGVRVVRLDIDEAGTAWMSVAVGRRVEHHDAVVDTVLVWRTVDLFLVAAMVELFDELLPAVQITRSAP